MLDEKDSLDQENVNQENSEQAAPEQGASEQAAREALEAAREAENKAYHLMSRAAVLTERQKGVMELARLEEIDSPGKAELDRKCRLILESYYLPHILKDGYTVKLDEDFTRFEDSGRDYIEAVFTGPSGKKMSVGYNYRTDEDGRNLLLFEKTFENVVLKPGDPEKYVLYAADGTTESESFSREELEKKVSKGEVVKVEEGFFRKAVNEDGEIRRGDTTIIVEDEGDSNVKIIMGNNEQEKFSVSKTGQLVCATTNDVTTVTVETRKFASAGPVYDSAEAARTAAEKEMQEGETNPHIDVVMEGTTVAEFSYLPVYTTSVELAGLSKKLGRGIEGYAPNESDEENLRRQFAKPIKEYLDEKGFHVIDITCENLEADVKENVGFMNTIRTYQMTGGTVSVTYIKKFTATVTLKQGFLGRGQNNDPATVLAQLPAGSELLNPQDIDWKSSKPEVAYILRGNATGVGSAKTVPEADDKAAENAILEAQKVVVKAINGGIASGIREAIAGKGAASTVANVRFRLNEAAVSKNDMQLTHKDAKYAYSGSCDRMKSSVENKLVAVTTWNGSLLTYVEPTDPIIDKGIPTDENYDKYVNEGDDMAILLFEKNDRGLRRYMNDVQDAQNQARRSREFYQRARITLKEAQEAFDKILDAKMQGIEESEELEELGEAEKTAESAAAEPILEEELTAPEELTAEAEAGGEASAEEAKPDTEETKPDTEETKPDTEETKPAAEGQLSAKEALLAIFGETADAPEAVSEETSADVREDLSNEEDEAEVDAAWEKLLMGMPKED